MTILRKQEKDAIYIRTMKFVLYFFTLTLFASCGLRENLDALDQGRKKSDAIIAHLADDSLALVLQEGDVKAEKLQALVSGIASQCNWEKKRGKFIDFFMASEKEKKQVSFIYEYFLDCDSLRFTLVYDSGKNPAALKSFFIEPLETKNPLLVDPMKSILKDPKWEDTH